jgi:hypothetical protein
MTARIHFSAAARRQAMSSAVGVALLGAVYGATLAAGLLFVALAKSADRRSVLLSPRDSDHPASTVDGRPDGFGACVGVPGAKNVQPRELNT